MFNFMSALFGPIANRPRINANNSMYTYSKPPVPFEDSVAYLVIEKNVTETAPYVLWGAGVVSGNEALNPPQLYSQLSVPPANLKGAGQYAGTEEYNALMTTTSLDNAYQQMLQALGKGT